MNNIVFLQDLAVVMIAAGLAALVCHWLHQPKVLGYMVAGDVPYAIPISWYYMLYCSLALCSRLLTADDSGAAKWRWASSPP